MSTVKALIRVSKAKKNKDVNIRFRLSDGRGVQLFHVSELIINSDLWDAKNECVKAKSSLDNSKKIELNRSILERKALIYDLYNAKVNKNELTSEWLEKAIFKSQRSKKQSVVKTKPKSFFDIFDLFLEKSRHTKERREHYHLLKRTLLRLQLYHQKKWTQDYILCKASICVLLI